MASENIYSGNIYSNDPNYKLLPYASFTGYRANFSKLGSAIDPFVANQIKEVSEHLNTGIKNIEVGVIKPETFGSIPKDQFKEMNRMAQLAGAEISMHAPMIDPTGIGEQGWNKLAQQMAERQLWDAVEKGQELNPKGTVITIHATSGFPGASETKIIDQETGKEKTVALTVINPTTGKIGQIGQDKERYFGSEDKLKPLPFNAEAELKRINEDQWMSTISNLNFAAERGKHQLQAIEAEKIFDSNPFFTKNLKMQEDFKQNRPDLYAQSKKEYEQAESELRHTKLFLREAYQNTKQLYDEIYSSASEEEKERLRNYAKEVIPFAEKEKFDNLEKNPEELKKFANTIEDGIKVISSIRPEIYKPIKQFAIEKSAETTANLAFKAYKEFELNGKSAPIIALENHPAQQALLTSGTELRAVVDKAREDFIKKAKAEGIDAGEAKKAAEKLIGATWDVGHINQLRGFGYGEEKIVDETKALKGVVKKVHLSDNFGMQNTELPMGMGNVPMQKIMEKLGNEGFEAKKIIEAGNWWTEFSRGTKANNPLIPTLGGLGVPLYAGGYTPQNIGWNQMYGVPGAYFAGFGTMLPDTNFQTYGAGFTSLPTELGGQMANKDRMTGTPMA